MGRESDMMYEDHREGVTWFNGLMVVICCVLTMGRDQSR